jgi:hypothetical protein
MIDFVFKIRNRIWQPGPKFRQNFGLTSSEDDQELKYEVCKTMYEVMIWVQDGLITIPTTLIIRSQYWFYTPRETYP